MYLYMYICIYVYVCKYVYMYPVALRAISATVPGIGKPSSQQLSKQANQTTRQPANQPPKINQKTFKKRSQNQPKMDQKSFKNQSKVVQNRSWRVSWGLLGPLGTILAPRRPQEGPKKPPRGQEPTRPPKGTDFGAILASKLAGRGAQNH